MPKDVEIEFISSFTSPSHGNVWEGRTLTLPEARAQKYIDNGLAIIKGGKRPVNVSRTITTLPTAPKNPRVKPQTVGGKSGKKGK